MTSSVCSSITLHARNTFNGEKVLTFEDFLVSLRPVALRRVHLVVAFLLFLRRSLVQRKAVLLIVRQVHDFYGLGDFVAVGQVFSEVVDAEVDALSGLTYSAGEFGFEAVVERHHSLGFVAEQTEALSQVFE